MMIRMIRYHSFNSWARARASGRHWTSREEGDARGRGVDGHGSMPEVEWIGGRREGVNDDGDEPRIKQMKGG